MSDNLDEIPEFVTNRFGFNYIEAQTGYLHSLDKSRWRVVARGSSGTDHLDDPVLSFARKKSGCLYFVEAVDLFDDERVCVRFPSFPSLHSLPLSIPAG